jgi:hypothetical protein
MDDAGLQNVGLLKPTRNANLNQNASDARASRGVERERKTFKAVAAGAGCFYIVTRGYWVSFLFHRG